MLAERDFELKKETGTFYKSERQRWSERQRHALDTLVREMVNKAAVVAERTLVALDDADAAAAAEQVASRRRASSSSRRSPPGRQSSMGARISPSYPAVFPPEDVTRDHGAMPTFPLTPAGPEFLRFQPLRPKTTAPYPRLTFKSLTPPVAPCRAHPVTAPENEPAVEPAAPGPSPLRLAR